LSDVDVVHKQTQLVCHSLLMLALYMYILRASNFRELSRIVKLNTAEIFGIAHHLKFICVEYQHFHDMICNICGSVM